MKEDKPNSEERADIRRQAEEVLKGKTTNLKKLSSGDVQSLVHELEVHQIELEMQNEELRRAQHELEDARNRYSDLYDFAPIGYFTFDKNGSILEVNLTGAKKLGRERGNLIKKPFSLYIHGNKDIFYSHLQKVFNTETQMTCELRLVDNKGNIYDAQLESMPVRDIDGNLLARTAMSDITGRKRAEKALRKAHDELEMRVQERTAELVEVNVALQTEIKERKRAETRIQHLNNTLGAIRNVNQLITREKDRERLVQKSCGLLVENRGWELVWILLVDKDQSYITAASDGDDEQFPILVEQMKRGNYPRCVRDTLIQGQPFITCDDVRKQHKGCDLSNCLAGRGAFAARLEHEGKVYGTITVGVLPELVLDEEEQSLFQELVTDLSYALAGIESEEERQRAEEDVKKSHKFLDTIIENIPDSLYIKNRQFRFVEVNKVFCHRHKVTKGEILGKPGYRETDERIFKTGKGLEIPEQHYTDAEGNQHWTHLKKVPLTDESGNVTHVLTISRDITERKRAEEKLREALLYTRNLFEASLDPLVTISPEGKITDVNKAIELVTGVPREKLTGSDFSDYFTEPEKAREGYQQVFEKGFVRDYPLAIRHVSGSTIDVLYNASVYNDSDGNAAGVFAAARDITARKKAEETLRKTEEKFRNVIENIFKFVPEGLVVLTDKLNLFRRNKAFEDLVRQYAVKLNYSEEELADILIEQIKTRLVSGEKSEIKISRKHK